jgi:alcohol dehydrogenase
VAGERTLRGSYIGSAVPAHDIPRHIQMYQRGKLPVDRLMGETLTLEDINRGFDRMPQGVAMRDVALL